MFIASPACEPRNYSKTSCGSSARKPKEARGSRRKSKEAESRPPDISEEMRGLRAWLDVVVVQRLVHIENTLALTQNGGRHGHQKSSLSPVVSRNATPEQLPSIAHSCSSKSLQMPSGDYSIDMDCEIPPVDPDAIWSPIEGLPRAGPPTSLLEGFGKPITDLGSDSNAGPVGEVSPSANICSGDDYSEDVDGSPPVENTSQSAREKDSEHEFRNADSVGSVQTFGRRPSLGSEEDLEKLLQKVKGRSSSSCNEVVWSFLDDPESSRAASMYRNIMVCFTLVAVGISVIQALDPPPLSGTVAFLVESVFELVFSLEFILRLAVCPDRMMFASNMHNIFDLTAALPLILRLCAFISGNYLEDGDSITCKALTGLVPMLRVLKTLRGFKQLHLLVAAVSLSIEALPICLFAMLALTLSFSAMIFMVEPRENIASYPHAMWLTMVTMTTLGYGDIMPSTSIGYLVISVIVVSSVLFMAMPLGIIGQAFTTVWQERDRILLVHCVRDRLRVWGYKPIDIPILFEWFDGDMSGELELNEFKHMIGEMNIGLSDFRIAQLFKSIDSDGGGSIDAREFTEALFPQYYEQIYGEPYKSEISD